MQFFKDTRGFFHPFAFGVTLLASAVVLGQLLMAFFTGETVCLNQGCKVVEELIRIPSLYFNIAGLLFFQLLFWLMIFANRGSKRCRYLSSTLLLTAIGVEAVLIGYQAVIAGTFCTYCLIIFCFVLVLNWMTGKQQCSTAFFVFVGVLFAFFAVVGPRSNATPPSSYMSGVFATRPGVNNEKELYFFFSSTCAHCEKVIAVLDSARGLTISFNPIDEIDELAIDNAVKKASYSVAANRFFLAALGIDEIPVLLVRDGEKSSVLRGEHAVVRAIRSLETDFNKSVSSGATLQRSQTTPVSGISSQEDGCSVDEECYETTDRLLRDNSTFR